MKNGVDAPCRSVTDVVPTVPAQRKDLLKGAAHE